MLEIASQVIVACDSSKIGTLSFVQFAPIGKVDRLITDEGIDDIDLKGFIEKGIHVNVVKT